jgi:hypothetical protein
MESEQEEAKMQDSQEQCASESSSRYLRLLPGVYSSVVVGSTVASHGIQGSAESFVCGIAVVALVTGFVAVAGRIGLWEWHDRQPSISRSGSELSLPGSPCRSSC